MLRFIVGIAVVMFLTFCGKLLARKYRERKYFFTEMFAFNVRFLEEVGYTKRPLEEFALPYKGQGPFSELLQRIVSARKVHRTTELNLSEYSFLSADEKRFVLEYFSAVGRGDAASQKSCFSQYGNTLLSLKSKGEEDCKKYEDLYTKLGFLLGLAVLIILI